jgi:hypothetical protein
MVDPGYPRAACQVRTPAGAAAHDRGDRQALRFGHPPSLVRAGHVLETVKQYLIATKSAGLGAPAPRFCRHDGTSCRQEPAQPSIVPTGNPRCVPVFRIRVLAGTGEASGTRYPAGAAPDRGHCANVAVPRTPELRGNRRTGRISVFRGVRAAGLAAGGWFVVLVAAGGIRNAAAELEVERGAGQQDGGGERHGRGDFILTRH